MFTTLASKGADALGKTYLYAGVAPALILLLGGWGMWSGMDVLQNKLSQLNNEKADSLAQLGGQILLIGFMLMVLRDRLVSWTEELPGPGLAILRNMLVSRALRKRSDLERQRDVFDAYYTSVNYLRERDSGPGYVPPAIALPDWESIAKLDEKARRARANTAPGLSRRKALRIAKVLALLDGYLLKGPQAPFHQPCLTARENWALWAKDEAVQKLLEEIEGTLWRELGAVTTKLRAFPGSVWIKPTRLGNCLSMLQDYAEKRYGVDTPLLWERIWWTLPDACKKEISDTRLLIESLMVLAYVWGAIALLGLMMAARSYAMATFGNPPPLMPRDACMTLLASGILFFTAYSTYLLVLVPVNVYANQVSSLIDMYRLSTLKQLGMRPTTIYEEAATMKAFDGFWRDGTSLGDWRQLHSSDKKSD